MIHGDTVILRCASTFDVWSITGNLIRLYWDFAMACWLHNYIPSGMHRFFSGSGNQVTVAISTCISKWSRHTERFINPLYIYIIIFTYMYDLFPYMFQLFFYESILYNNFTIDYPICLHICSYVPTCFPIVSMGFPMGFPIGFPFVHGAHRSFGKPRPCTACERTNGLGRRRAWPGTVSSLIYPFVDGDFP